MRFTTASGSTYELTEINEQEGGAGYDAYLVRDGVPLVDLLTGGEMSELYAQRIYYTAPPVVGDRFRYFTRSHAGVISTPVVSIDGEEASTD